MSTGNCELRPRLDAYHDGELSPGERSDVEFHLRHCPSCAAELVEMRQVSGAFAGTPLPEPSHEQLLHLAQGVRAERSDALMLLRLFRGAAVAAAVLLACAIGGAVYLSHKTKAAAHQAMVLDHAATWSQPEALSPGATMSDAGQPDQQVRLAQWIADDLRGRQEER